MLTLHQLLGNKQPQTPNTTLRQRQRHSRAHCLIPRISRSQLAELVYDAT